MNPGRLPAFARALALALASLMLLGGATGCGATNRGDPMASKSLSSNFDPNGGNNVDTGTDPTDTTGTGTDTTDGNVGTAPTLLITVQGIGYSTHEFDFRVRKVLRVRFRPGIESRKIAGTGIAPRYSQLGVYLEVNGDEKPTPMLSNGLLTGTPETSSTIDFSHSFVPTCPETDASCRQSVKLVVKKPNNDLWCLMAYWQACPWSHVEDDHPWTGTLIVQTDDTRAL